MIGKNNDQKIESYDYDPGVNMEWGVTTNGPKCCAKKIKCLK